MTKLYTVQQMAKEIGVSDGLIYQGIASGQIKVASDELLKELGLNPAIIRKPKRWITAEEVEKYKAKPRTTAEDVFRKKSAYGVNYSDQMNPKNSAYGTQNIQYTVEE